MEEIHSKLERRVPKYVRKCLDSFKLYLILVGNTNGCNVNRARILQILAFSTPSPFFGLAYNIRTVLDNKYMFRPLGTIRRDCNRSGALERKALDQSAIEIPFL